MTLRARLVALSLVVVVVPLAVFGLGIRERVTAQLSRQYERRVTLLVDVIRHEIEQESDALAGRLRATAERLAQDNRFRQFVLRAGEPEARGHVLDYAANAMRVSGFTMLQIQDAAGRIVSSGHFRNEFDLADPALPRALRRTTDGPAIVRPRTPEGTFLALARIDSTVIGGLTYTLVGGTTLNVEALGRLAATDELSVQLVLPGDTTTVPALVAGEIRLPYVATEIGRSATVEEARFVVAQSAAPIARLRASINAWFAAAVIISAIVAGALALWLAARIARPITALAAQTARLDLDTLDVSFASDRKDEVGQLQRFLGAMTTRLRASVRSLKEVERRAAMGDLARQVNHDVKNGLTPIRNVLRHLSQVAEENPAELGKVFRERRRTLETSVEYLERLAANYAGLYPRLDRSKVDANDVVRGVMAHLDTPGTVAVELDLVEGTLPVRTDRLALRRVLENLVGNAVDSLNGEPGSVLLRSERSSSQRGEAFARLVVCDSGPGMTREELDRAVGDFYSTKSHGTGLGLTIVRRLVTDLGGTFRIRTEPGAGTECMVELPLDGQA